MINTAVLLPQCKCVCVCVSSKSQLFNWSLLQLSLHIFIFWNISLKNKQSITHCQPLLKFITHSVVKIESSKLISFFDDKKNCQICCVTASVVTVSLWLLIESEPQPVTSHHRSHFNYFMWLEAPPGVCTNASVSFEMDVLIHVDFLLREVAYDIAIEDPILDELWFCQGHWMHRGEMVISPDTGEQSG